MVTPLVIKHWILTENTMKGMEYLPSPGEDQFENQVQHCHEVWIPLLKSTQIMLMMSTTQKIIMFLVNLLKKLLLHLQHLYVDLRSKTSIFIMICQIPRITEKVTNLVITRVGTVKIPKSHQKSQEKAKEDFRGTEKIVKKIVKIARTNLLIIPSPDSITITD